MPDTCYKGRNQFRVTTLIPTVIVTYHAICKLSFLLNVQLPSRTTLTLIRAAPVGNSHSNLNLRKFSADDFLSLKGY